MMPEKSKEVLRKLKKIGFVEIRSSGSHIILEKKMVKGLTLQCIPKTYPKALFMQY